MISWESLLIPAGLLLVVPLTVIPAFARPTGSIIVSAALGTAALAIFWLALGGINVSVFNGVNMITLLIGLLATLTAWALSMNAAAQTRRWVWVAVLVVAGYLTYLAIFVSMSTFQPCYPEADFTMTCPPEDPLRHALIIAGYLVCPVAALVYGARPSLRRARKPLEGLAISSLRAAPSADVDNSGGGE